ncbi:MAG TPA: dihydrolipoamide acetyltransferase family protein [Candidatus Dormibacteraeota bacterium]|nr:dihydrolipoamide acetyltransferase family protein [Candidatus Dormibacteraeota bacterium]
MANAIRITMPQLGESVHEGTISKWLVKPGDKVVEFEPMMEVETDKVATEVPSPVTGILKEILAADGTTVASGGEIAVVEVEGDAGASKPSAPAAKPEAAPTQPAGEVGPMPTKEEVPAAPAAAAGTAAAKEARAATPEPLPEGDRLESGEHRYSPAVRMLAEQNQVDLESIRGTGLGGRVTKKDVEAAAAGRATAPALQAAAAAQTAAPAASPAEAPGDQRVPLGRIKRLVGENMVKSKSTIPHAWQTQEVDMSGVVANRNANKGKFAQQEGFSLTFLPYVVMAAVVALREHPDVNATFGGDAILLHRDINVGISVGMEDALVVPVIRRADSLSLAGIARAINDLASRARDGKLKGDDLAGGTFTVNNSGTFGTLFSYSVIAPGQAGILTMEAIVERPVAVGGMIGIKPMMYACFSFDHRILDGLQAARFLVSCRKWLESVKADTQIY